MQDSDQIIIRQIRAGNTQAFASLIDRYQDMVFSICMKLLKDRVEAEEVAHQVFIRAYTKLGTYSAKASFSTWLYRIAYNRSLDVLKTSQRSKTVDLSQFNGAFMEEDQLEVKERHAALGQAIDRLDDGQQLLVLLYYYEEKSVKEIADIVQLSESNVKVKLHRARQQLRLKMERTYENK